jgi:type IV pilus assembly protein PilB
VKIRSSKGLARTYGIPHARLEPRLADPKAIETLPRDYIEKNLVFPLFSVRETLTVAVCEPTNLFLIDEIRGITGREVQVVAASPKDIRRMITTLPDSKTFVIDDIIDDGEQSEVTLIEDSVEDIGELTEFAGQSPVIRLVNYIIFWRRQRRRQRYPYRARRTLLASAVPHRRAIV